MRSALASAVVFALLGGCGGVEDPAVDATLDGGGRGAVSLVALRSVEWNPAGADVGMVSAVADEGGTVMVFTDRGARVIVNGAPGASLAQPTQWRGAGVIDAADGNGRWIVGLAEDGRVRRLREAAELVDVSARWGLDGDRVRSVATIGEGATAFGAEGLFVVATPSRVLRYDDPGFASLRGHAGRVVSTASGAARVFTVSPPAMVRYDMPGLIEADVGADGRVVAVAEGGLYVEDETGELRLRYEAAAGERMHGLAVSGERVWVGAATEMLLLENGAIRRSQGLGLTVSSRLYPASDGEVWELVGGRLRRYGVLAADSEDERRWETLARPAQLRVCGMCHAPRGPNFDLSTYAAWAQRRADIRAAVVVDRRMPLAPATITDQERDDIARWLDGEPTADAGSPDATTDATADDVMDAAAVDVRDASGMDVRDTGPRDTGPRDTGADVRDAGPRDTGADVRDTGADVRDAGATDAGPPTFTAVYAIITARCVSCHGGSGGLNMSTRAMAHANLVGASAAGSACGSSGLTRVVAGDASRSLLYEKVSGTPSCGVRMPRNVTALTAAQIETIRAWIAAGARND
ncbi:MAG: hypothetical protein R3A52_11140 [Polyangiales bacterium]